MPRTIKVTDALYKVLLALRGPRTKARGNTLSDVITDLVDPSDALAAYEAGEIDEDELEQLAPGVFDLAEDEEDDDANVDPDEDEDGEDSSD